MSNTYPDYTHTTFPDSLDDEKKYGYMNDINADQINNVNAYQSAFLSGNTKRCEAILAAHPELKSCMWTATNYNWLRDTIIAMQHFYKDNVEDMVKKIASNTIGIDDSVNVDSDASYTNTYSVNKINSLFKVFTVTIKSTDWVASANEGNLYSATVDVPGLNKDHNYELFKNISKDSSIDSVKEYNKGFGYICAGECTEDNKITLYAYRCPTTDLSI